MCTKLVSTTLQHHFLLGTKAKVITQSGHVVLVSGLVLTIAYGSMLCLPGLAFFSTKIVVRHHGMMT